MLDVSRFPPSALRLLPAAAALSMLTACLTQGPKVSLPEPAAVKIRLIAINDFHGTLLPPENATRLPGPAAGEPVSVPLGGAAYLATAVSRLKAGNPLNVVVAAGDLISASPLESALFHDEPAIAALDAMGLEISAVGNHEFDDGRDALLRIQRGGCAPDGMPEVDTCIGGRFPGARFQYLAANVVDSASGAPLLPATAVRSFEAGGRRLSIGFIGLTLAGTPDLVSRDGIRGLRFEDEIVTINREAAALRADGIEAIVVLIHEGGYIEPASAYDDERCPGFSGEIARIAARLDPAVDVMVSGHTHRAYKCRLASRDPAKTLLVTSAGHAGRFVSSLDLELDPETGDVIASRADTLPVVNDRPGNAAPSLYPPLPATPGLAAMVEIFRARAEPLAARPVGRVAAAILRTVADSGEQPLGMVIADAQLAYAAKAAETRAEIAFMNPDGVRADLEPLDAAGTVSFGQVYSVQPFGSELVTLSLSGAQIRRLLEQQWRAKGRSPVLLPSKGFRYQWHADRPVGERVDAASITLNGVVVDPAKRYRVNVNGFLANGGDGFTVLTEGTERQAFGLDREALIDYLARFGPVAVPADARIERAPALPPA